MTTKQKTVPKLRFPIGTGAFQRKRLDAIVSKKISYGIVQAGDHVPDGMPYIKSQDLNGPFRLESLQRTSAEIAKKYKRSEVFPGDIVFSLRGNIGIAQIVPASIPVSNLTQGTARISVQDHDNQYVCLALQSLDVFKQVQAFAKGSTFREISLDDLRKVTVAIPPLPEQRKIAGFLTAVDGRIGQLSQKKALLEDYKRGVMQQLFTQALRFKDEHGNDFPDWEEKTLGDVFERVKRRNVGNDSRILTISALDGLVDQRSYFDRSIASKDASGYYLLYRDEFAYNKSYSKGYPMGAIKRLTRYDKGSVSPLYICFSVKPSADAKFFSHYFDGGILNSEIESIAQEGARNHGLLNVSVVEFFRDLTVQLPSLPEQTKIADFLSALDRKIESVSSQIRETQAFKKGLLQQMFV